MADFFVGQKVAWIGPTLTRDPRARKDVGDKLSKDDTYEVSWIGMHLFSHEGSDRLLPACRLLGITRISQGRDLRDLRRDVPWGQTIFRPVQSKSIEVFRQIARDVTEGKKVRIRA